MVCVPATMRASTFKVATRRLRRGCHGGVGFSYVLVGLYVSRVLKPRPIKKPIPQFIFRYFLEYHFHETLRNAAPWLGTAGRCTAPVCTPMSFFAHKSRTVAEVVAVGRSRSSHDALMAVALSPRFKSATAMLLPSAKCLAHTSVFDPPRVAFAAAALSHMLGVRSLP